MGKNIVRNGNCWAKTIGPWLFSFLVFLNYTDSGISASTPTGESGIFTLPSAETVGADRAVLGFWSRYQTAGHRSDLAPSPFSLELGLGRRFEGGIGLQKLREADPLSRNENTGLRVNGKYRFLDEHPRAPALALLASIGHITSNPDYGMQIILTKTFFPLLSSLTLGYSQGENYQGSKTEVITGGIGVILPIMRNLEILGELKTVSFDSASQLTNMVPGIRYAISPTVNLALGLEVGIGLENILWSLTAGLSLTGPSACPEVLEASQISPRYRKEAPSGKTSVSDEEPRPEFTTPTPTFRLRIPMMGTPAEEVPSEPPEDQDEPSQ